MFDTFIPTLRAEIESAASLDIFDRMVDEAGLSPWTMVAGTRGEAGFAVDVSETGGEVLVRAEMPGFEPANIAVTLRDNVLVLRGEKKLHKIERGENFVRTERSYGTFSRAIPMPDEVSGGTIRTSYEHGVLSVRLAKAMPSVPERFGLELRDA